MDKTPYSPTVLLRCGRCRSKTHHALISFSNNPVLAISLVYECQECGETRKVFDLSTLPQVAWEPAMEIKAEEKKEKEPAIPIERGPQIEQSTG